MVSTVPLNSGFGHRQHSLVLDIAGAGDQAGDFFLVQDNGSLARNAHRLHFRQLIAVTQRHIKQVLQTRDGGITHKSVIERTVFGTLLL
jgi:hypothetical protein